MYLTMSVAIEPVGRSLPVGHFNLLKLLLQDRSSQVKPRSLFLLICH